MAITYPITLPSSGIASVEWRSVNATVVSQSPFTYRQQVVAHGGQRWEATVNLAPMSRDTAAAWKAALVSLRGTEGTMLLGDPSYALPRGTLRTSVSNPASVTGTAGDKDITIAMTDNTETLLAGDFIQIGTSAGAELYQVLEDLTGDGDVEIFPNLRTTYSAEPLQTNDSKGVFRLASNISSWSIDNASIYGISFEVVEAIV